jgi:1,6-anhydro-N-acetylmuramate kinase
MFRESAVMASGGNFLEAKPPKSSDPQWYKNIEMLDDDKIPAVDKLRTAEYFSAYLTYHSLGHTPDDMQMPSDFAVFGGGWKNPIVMEDFKKLLEGEHHIVLPEHDEWFAKIKSRITNPEIKFSNEYGFDGTMMEARIFADMARCLVIGRPFTSSETTGAKKQSVGGVVAYADNVSNNLKEWLKESGRDLPVYEGLWSRASAGWESVKPKVKCNYNA